MKELPLLLLVLVATAVVNGYSVEYIVTYNGVPVNGYAEFYDINGRFLYSSLVRSGVLIAQSDEDFAILQTALFISNPPVVALFDVIVEASSVIVASNIEDEYSIEITSLPFTVNVSSNANVIVKLRSGFEIEFKTNKTIHSMYGFILEFPVEFKQGSFKYVLKNITVNGNLVDSNVVYVDNSMNIYAYYDVVEEPFWLPLLIVIIIAVMLVVISVATSRRSVLKYQYEY